MFKVMRLDPELNIYAIINRDVIDDDCKYITIPFEVYGVLKVEGENYDDSEVYYRYISDAVYISLSGLIEDARRDFFNLNLI